VVSAKLPRSGQRERRYYPAGSRWQLRLFEEPAVPWPGYYTACFYDEHDNLLGTVEQIAVSQGSERVPLGSGDRKLHLRA
jgi:hypothetical protein